MSVSRLIFLTHATVPMNCRSKRR